MSTRVPAGDDDPSVTYERDRSVGLITIDRPPVNAYDERLHWELDNCWQRAAADDDARVVVLQAEGPHFCAGADVSGDGRRAPEGATLRPPWEELTFIRNLMKPTIAAVQGGCVGGGQRLVFPCDLIFCSEDAFFLDPLASMGIGGIQAPLHVWLYGERVAKEMLYAGERVPAARLCAMGSVNRLYPPERLHAETLAFARGVAEVDPGALRQAKRAVNTTLDIMGQHYIVNRFAELLDDDLRSGGG